MITEPKTQMRCLCGMTMWLKDGKGCCSNCGRTPEMVRDYQRSAAADRRNRRGTSRELQRLAHNRRVEISKAAIAQRNFLKTQDCPTVIEPVIAQGPDKPLLPMRHCHDCGEPTWDYRCPKCRGLHAKKYGV